MRIKINFIIVSILITSFLSAQQIGDGRSLEINNFSTPLRSGIYQGYLPNGMNPDQIFGWQHLFVIRHSNDTNNYQLQLSSSYSQNDRLFFRKIAGALESNNPDWIELASRGTNTFTGNQIITGNVGIGTVSPNSRLDLGKGYGINGAKFLIYNDDATSELSGTKCGFYMDNFTPNNLNLVFPESENFPGLFTISAKNTSGTNLTPYFSIAGMSGNIGIGVSNPKNKLDVKGTVHAQEVKVDMFGWSDFVFKKEYNLPTLEQVEKHITEKGHLENIPSEEEVLKNGINLGEMNAKLLQKIEELTLYMIEMKKENENMKKDILNLKQNK
ncbi:hypothetical protein [Flavobacterium branchiicola]|uniref:Cell wall anchor protein n=1 Tax=Flavobacterium branchiicola TaxID=1114875 RepID=A0ABV9PMQ8_9FLAO|nr:hypothetical protein [Flavobacterium branchiicola]MBS7256728.1 hypothetical protein [Flavobacterium branchiicola]